MSKKNLILIGGALALFWYARKHKLATPSAATLAAGAPNSSTQYTTQQAAESAEWWTFAGSWA